MSKVHFVDYNFEPKTLRNVHLLTFYCNGSFVGISDSLVAKFGVSAEKFLDFCMIVDSANTTLTMPHAPVSVVPTMIVTGNNDLNIRPGSAFQRVSFVEELNNWLSRNEGHLPTKIWIYISDMWSEEIRQFYMAAAQEGIDWPSVNHVYITTSGRYSYS